MRTAYISGALTDMTEERRAELRAFYEALGEVCREFGLDPYLPHIYGDPKRLAHLTPQQIDRIDRLAVTLSYVVIAYVGETTTGGGIEVEMAYHANKPVILVYEQAKLEKRLISRPVRGNPAVRDHVIFIDEADALQQLRTCLVDFCRDIADESLPDPLALLATI